MALAQDASRAAPEGAALPGSPLRIGMASLGLLALVGALLYLARLAADAPLSASDLLVSVLAAVAAILLLGSLYEWLVHRFIYHAPSRVSILNRIFEIHQHGHHWHRFPPSRYVESGPVERIPIHPHRPLSLCRSPARRTIAWLAQYGLYLSVGIPFAFLPAWLLTRNVVFTASAIVSGLAVCYLFIRIHDVIHYPAGRRLERRAWFRFLDRHHYLHHIDTRSNLNFLLPLCDLLFGTLRRRQTEEELRRWPSFEEAKAGGRSR